MILCLESATTNVFIIRIGFFLWHPTGLAWRRFFKTCDRMRVWLVWHIYVSWCMCHTLLPWTTYLKQGELFGDNLFA
jgi:hypothetical protein